MAQKHTDVPMPVCYRIVVLHFLHGFTAAVTMSSAQRALDLRPSLQEDIVGVDISPFSKLYQVRVFITSHFLNTYIYIYFNVREKLCFLIITTLNRIENVSRYSLIINKLDFILCRILEYRTCQRTKV